MHTPHDLKYVEVARSRSEPSSSHVKPRGVCRKKVNTREMSLLPGMLESLVVVLTEAPLYWDLTESMIVYWTGFGLAKSQSNVSPASYNQVAYSYLLPSLSEARFSRISIGAPSRAMLLTTSWL